MGRPAFHEFRGHLYTKRQLAHASGVPFDTLRQRLRIGWTIEQAVSVPTIEQRRRGVVSNFDVIAGTGGGSTAQETPNITFPQKANS